MSLADRLDARAASCRRPTLPAVAAAAAATSAPPTPCSAWVARSRGTRRPQDRLTNPACRPARRRPARLRHAGDDCRRAADRHRRCSSRDRGGVASCSPATWTPGIGPDDVLGDRVVVAAWRSWTAGSRTSPSSTPSPTTLVGLFTLGRAPPRGDWPARCAVARGEVSTGSGACLGPGRASPGSPHRRSTSRAPGRAVGALGPWSGPAGDRFTAEIGGLGQVTAVFAGGTR